jgi:hypothetical protein
MSAVGNPVTKVYEELIADPEFMGELGAAIVRVLRHGPRKAQMLLVRTIAERILNSESGGRRKPFTELFEKVLGDPANDGLIDLMAVLESQWKGTEVHG